MESIKKFLPLIFVVFLIISLGVALLVVRQNQEFRSQAAPSTAIVLESSIDRINVGDEFTVIANVTTGENQIAGAEMYIKYDPAVVSAKSAAPGTFLVNPDLQEHGPIIDDTAGSVFYSIYLPVDTQAVSGQGELARFSFTALAAGSTTISIGNESVVVAIAEGGQDVLQNTTGVTLTISNPTNSQATSSPTATAQATATATAFATSSPGSGGNTTPTPAASASATPFSYYYATATPISQVPSDLPVTGIETPFVIMVGIAGLLFGTAFFLLR